MSKLIKQVEILDSTLRDGTQGANVSFSLDDKILIAKKLDEFGISYIEGGFPLSNKKDAEFFKRVRNEKFSHAKIAAFGSTKKPKVDVASDVHLNALIDAETPVVVVVGKSWTVHVTDIIRTTLDENLEMIAQSVRYLKSKGREVIFDGEHFFDGFRGDSGYAVEVFRTAHQAGADCLVMCDTNGGFTTNQILKIVGKVRASVDGKLGIHVHNDSDMAVASSVCVVEEGVEHIQGTINGYGERCGNANLCSVIPTLKLKMNINCVSNEQLASITNLSRFIAELANLPHNDKASYVGRDAFAHKAGQHVDALKKNEFAMEHIRADLVGNERRILISELAGKSSVAEKLSSFRPNLTKTSPEIALITEKLKELESFGYEFEAAEASFELLVKRCLNEIAPLFDLRNYQVSVSNSVNESDSIVGGVRLFVKGIPYEGSAYGDGPVDALGNSLKKALQVPYPLVDKIRLVDYKVRVVNTGEGTAAKVRVFVRSSDGGSFWDTIGVSESIVEASWRAIVDSLEYKLAVSHNS